MPTYAIVTAVIKKDGKFLIAKRADTKHFAPGEWEFIAGFMDKRGSAEEIILEELKEELNAEGKVIASVPAFEFMDKEGRWITIPFLVELITKDLQADPREHSELRWVNAKELEKYDQLAPFLNDPGFRSLLS